MIDQRTFGQAVRAHREAMGMSVAKLAEEIGVTARYIYQIEAGMRAPRSKVILRLIGVLGIDIGKLIEENEPMGTAENG